MKVHILASTAMNGDVMYEAYGYRPYSVEGQRLSTDADTLGEAAGRLCYKSFNRPNPATANNAGYMANIIAQGHESVMEHASVTFLVRGVSRSLLTELTRHRHLSFSVVSQRYVDYAGTHPVIPPAIRGTEAETLVCERYEDAVRAYTDLVKRLEKVGLKRKAAREAARSVLLNAAPVDMIVTGNLRAWRDVLRKRWHVAADAEIREFAGKVLYRLRSVAPNSFQDIPDEPYGENK